MVEKFSSMESREIPRAVLDYLHSKHETIINDYRTPDGRYSEHCGLIVIDIARLLLQANRQPYIMKVAEETREDGFIRSKALVPTIYAGRVTWGAHQVCCCDGLAFDPILETPVPIEDYTKTVFGEDIKMEALVPYEQIEKFINR